jgi:hypothetical protein
LGVELSGYTPLFSSLTTGTLYGRWPDIGVWPIVLSLGDKNGVVDVTPHYLAGVTGLPVADVIACMKRFCEPDPYSRSKAENGSRLVLVDEHRDWGWRIVNHGRYREKARKQMQQNEATESGRDAERKKVARERSTSGDVQRSPAMSSADRLSDSDSDSDSEKIKNKNPPLASARVPPRGATATRLPADFDLTPERRAIAEAEKADPEREFASFTDHFRAAPGVKGRKNDWDATWRNWCRRAPDFKPRNGAVRKADYVPPKTVEQIEDEAIARGIASGKSDHDIARDVDIDIERVRKAREAAHAQH